jgi:SAM-dependent methyltransferase
MSFNEENNNIQNTENTQQGEIIANNNMDIQTNSQNNNWDDWDEWENIPGIVGINEWGDIIEPNDDIEPEQMEILFDYLNNIQTDFINKNKNHISEGCKIIYEINHIETIYNYYYKLMEYMEFNDNSYNKDFTFEILIIIKPYIDNILLSENKYKDKLFLKFIRLLCMCKNGNHILVKYKKRFPQYKNIYKSYVLSKAKFHSFKIIFDTSNALNMNHTEMNDIICSAAFNYDDRVYKFVMNFYKKNVISYYESTFSMSFFNSILHHPQKYIFKRLKYIEDIINQKDEYIYNLFSSNKMTFEIFSKLVKFYYYNKPNIIFHISIIKRFVNNFKESSKNILNMLKTDKEKCNLCEIYLYEFKILIDEKYLSFDKFSSYLSNYFFKYYKIGNDKYTDSKLHLIIEKIYKHYKQELNFYYAYSSGFRLYLLPYLKYFNFKDKNKYKIIYLYIKLSSFIRRIKMKKVIMRKMILSPMLNELNNLTPNNNIKIMKKGTMFYQNKMQRFNTIPPHHMFPNEIEGMTDILIREKADGILVTELPKNIFPEITFDCKIKAEYIEELDLYLIFDIDMNICIEERYRYLRSSHDDTFKTDLVKINSMDEFIIEMNKERALFNKFMDKDYNTYRWYPKIAFKIDFVSDDIAQSIYDFINMESPLNEHNNNGSYENDGYIITPLNGDNEIKIKPRDKMTIDLECKNKQLCDSDGNVYGVESLSNGIYRRHPNGTFEHRYDKFKANSYKIINNIINLSKIYYTLGKKLYYTDKEYNYNHTWDIITKNNNKNFIDMNKLMYPEESILDLGCGKGKVLSLSKDTLKQKYYTGYDYDHYILSKARRKFNNATFNYIDLRGDWDKTNEKYYNVKYYYYKNIYAINSLMHFNTESFWYQLNKVSTKGTRFMFNLLDSNNDNWEHGQSYLKKNEKIIELYFEYIHNKPLTEKFITINDVIPYLEKYHFNIISQKQYNTDNAESLTKLYTWYIVEKF